MTLSNTIELIGFPGVGKSSLARAVIRELSCEWEVADRDRCEAALSAHHAARAVLVRRAHFAVYLAHQATLVREGLLVALGGGRPRLGALRFYATLLRKVRNAGLRRALVHQPVIVLDQDLVQYLWGVQFLGGAPSGAASLSRFIDRAEPLLPATIVHLEADPETILRRLRERQRELGPQSVVELVPGLSTREVERGVRSLSELAALVARRAGSHLVRVDARQPVERSSRVVAEALREQLGRSRDGASINS